MAIQRLVSNKLQTERAASDRDISYKQLTGIHYELGWNKLH